MKAHPRETTEAFLDGHVAALGFFGGVPRSTLYDNTRIAVARICGDGKRERTLTLWASTDPSERYALVPLFLTLARVW